MDAKRFNAKKHELGSVFVEHDTVRAELVCEIEQLGSRHGPGIFDCVTSCLDRGVIGVH